MILEKRQRERLAATRQQISLACDSKLEGNPNRLSRSRRGKSLQPGSAEAALHLASARLYLSPLRYPGGKRKLVSRIGWLMDRAGDKRFSTLIEPFAGGASVAITFLEAGLVDRVFLADRDPMVAAFWSVVFSSNATKLAEKVRTADLDVSTWIKIKAAHPDDIIGLAFQCIYLNRTSFSGSLHPGAGPIGGKEQKSAHWIGCRFNREAVAKRIEELSAFADRVTVHCLHYSRFFNDWQEVCGWGSDNDSLFWYLDPPFFHKADKLYRHVFAAEDHEELRLSLDTLPGRWLLSYDACPEATAAYRSHPGFGIVDMRYSAGADQTLRSISKSEVIVSNFFV